MTDVATYCVNPEWARAELDYADMVALSGMFRRWAIYESDESITPEHRTWLIEYSADFERIAEWVGEGWRATEPSEQLPLIKFIADWERRSDNVIDLAAYLICGSAPAGRRPAG